MVNIEKYGFEFENYGLSEQLSGEGDCDNCCGCGSYFEEIEWILSSMGLSEIIDGVKEDGSLGCGGYEVNSVVFEGIEPFKEGLLKMVKAAKSRGHTPQSPAAIHIHCSGLKKPLGFVYQAHKWDVVFNKIVSLNNSSLMNNTTGIEGIPIPPESPSICRTVSEFEQTLNNVPLSPSRYHTIRNAFRTLEFRPFPTRLNEDYIKAYLKIYEGIKKRSNYLSVKNSYGELLKFSGLNVVDLIPEFKKAFKLSNKDLFTLGNKITGDSKKKFKQIKNEGAAPIDFLRGYIPEQRERERERFILNALTLEDLNRNEAYTLPRMDLNSPEDVYMYNRIQRGGYFEICSNRFRFSETPILRIYQAFYEDSPHLRGELITPHLFVGYRHI